MTAATMLDAAAVLVRGRIDHRIVAVLPRRMRRKLERVRALGEDLERELAFLDGAGPMLATLVEDEITRARTWRVHHAIDGDPPPEAVEIVRRGDGAAEGLAGRRREIETIAARFRRYLTGLRVVVRPAHTPLVRRRLPPMRRARARARVTRSAAERAPPAEDEPGAAVRSMARRGGRR
jgi:hypothetical protein